MRNILIVEDEKMIRMGIRVILQNGDIPHQMIRECRNGKEAIELLKETVYDLVITDIRMPGMDGIQLSEWICNHIEEENRPSIIAVSGYAEFNYVREIMKNGAVDYILKPVDNEELIQLCWKIEEAYKNKLRERGIYQEDGGEVPNSTFLNRKKIQEAVDYIYRNYKKNLDMVEVSNYVSMNYTVFSSEFKKYTHQSFPSFLKKLRIEKAKRLIKQTDLKLNEIAQRVGFEDQARFAKVFKEETGISPKTYRESSVE